MLIKDFRCVIQSHNAFIEYINTSKKAPISQQTSDNIDKNQYICNMAQEVRSQYNAVSLLLIFINELWLFEQGSLQNLANTFYYLRQWNMDETVTYVDVWPYPAATIRFINNSIYYQRTNTIWRSLNMLCMKTLFKVYAVYDLGNWDNTT